jgi:TetR/AcrR family transcriptional repressor of mexJK operon
VRTKTPAQAEKIVEAAARLFGTQRFHEVRMDDVALAAEVGKGTLYRYFRDKEELFTGLLEHALDRFQERIRQEVAKATGARQRLEALVGAIISYFDEHPHLMNLIQRGELTHRGDRPFVWSYSRVGVLRLIADLFEEGQAQGEFAGRDTELAAMMLLGGIRTVIRAGAKPRPADLARRIVDTLLWGAATPGPSLPAAERRRKGNGVPVVARN